MATLIGLLGTLLIAVGGLGAGAFPVIHNPYWEFPGVSFLARMLHATTVLVFLGIGFLVTGWLMLSRFAVLARRRSLRPVPQRTLWRIFALWVAPLMFTTPLFTQDIYSYLAQGAIAARGWDPYSAGPVDLLGIEDPLARSVPLMWAHSPAPYGPTALGYGAVISWLTNNSILWGIFAHRVVAVLGLALAGWAIVRLARRCAVFPPTALWLGVLNPLAILHLIGGIHNEAAMLGLLLAGMELVLRGVEASPRSARVRWLCILLGFVLIAGAGMVKVTAFIALGFAGTALARWLGGRLRHLFVSAGIALVVAAGTAVALSAGSGVGFGWVSSQGGAVEVKSWMSISTLAGLLSSIAGSLLGLGDHEHTALALFRGMGILVGLTWVVRMLWASYRGRIHPIGALGVATLLLVLFFPVVHPWYLLWAFLPLSAWANQKLFLMCTVLYSVAFSFFILPRGLGLPIATVWFIYGMSAVLFALFWFLALRVLRRFPAARAAIHSESWNVTTVRLREDWRRGTRAFRARRQLADTPPTASPTRGDSQ